MTKTQTQNEIKYSKKGWPITACEHNVGHIVAERWFAEALVQRLNGRHNATFELRPTATENLYHIVTQPIRMSLMEFATIRAYIDGIAAMNRAKRRFVRLGRLQRRHANRATRSSRKSRKRSAGD